MLNRRTTILILLGYCLASCTGAQGLEGQTPVPSSELYQVISPVASLATSTVDSGPVPSPDLSGFAFPSRVVVTHRYLFYLHGKIIEDQGLPAVSPEFGEYRYKEILRVFQSYGFVVISEQRPKNADGMEYARRVAGQIAELVHSGLPSDSITVVGASKGGAITAIVSYLVGLPEVNYVLLGACNPPTFEEWMRAGIRLSGNVLAIYDYADEYAGSCEGMFKYSEGSQLGQHAELVLHVGTGHGILYQPLDEWIAPTVRWANQDW